MGTPDFAVPSLEGLINSNYQIAGVYTSPDKPAGRGQQQSISAIKKVALANNIEVRQPVSLRDPEEYRWLASLQPHLVVVAAYGRILPGEIIDIPEYGCINVHPSLLPQYRGATPVPAAILSGDSKTGVSIISMDEGMDTGPVIAMKEAEILPEETAATLTERLGRLGAELLLETIPGWMIGAIKPVPQDGQRATYTKVIRKEDGLLDWRLPAEYLERQSRAYKPWPGIYTYWRGKRLEVTKATVMDNGAGSEAGEVRTIDKGASRVVGVTTGNGILLLERVRMEGKKEISGDEFARGQRDFIGSRLT